MLLWPDLGTYGSPPKPLNLRGYVALLVEWNEEGQNWKVQVQEPLPPEVSRYWFAPPAHLVYWESITGERRNAYLGRRDVWRGLAPAPAGEMWWMAVDTRDDDKTEGPVSVAPEMDTAEGDTATRAPADRGNAVGYDAGEAPLQVPAPDTAGSGARRGGGARCGQGTLGRGDGGQPTDNGQEWKKGDWSCSRCTDHQFAANQICRWCGLAKGVGPQEPGEGRAEEFSSGDGQTGAGGQPPLGTSASGDGWTMAAEVETFCSTAALDETAVNALRAARPDVQRAVIARGQLPPSYPSKSLMRRITEAKIELGLLAPRAPAASPEREAVDHRERDGQWAGQGARAAEEEGRHQRAPASQETQTPLARDSGWGRAWEPASAQPQATQGGMQSAGSAANTRNNSGPQVSGSWMQEDWQRSGAQGSSWRPAQANCGAQGGWGTRGSGASSSGGGYTWQYDRGVSGGNAWQTTGEVRGDGWGGSGGGGDGQGWMDDREAREKFLNEVVAKFRAMGVENLVIRGPG